MKGFYKLLTFEIAAGFWQLAGFKGKIRVILYEERNNIEIG